MLQTECWLGCRCGCCSVFITFIFLFFCLWHATCCWLWSSSATDESALFEATPNKFEFATLQGAFAPFPKRLCECVLVGRGLCAGDLHICKTLGTATEQPKIWDCDWADSHVAFAFNLCRLPAIPLWLLASAIRLHTNVHTFVWRNVYPARSVTALRLAARRLQLKLSMSPLDSRQADR